MKPKNFIKLFFIVFISMMVLSITVVYASSFKYPKLFEDKHQVFKAPSPYTPSINSYPFTEEDITSVGFDTLFGSSKGLSTYKGEVPVDLADRGEGKKLRNTNNTKINGIDRPWSSNHGLEESDIIPESTEYHIRGNVVSSSPGGINFVLFHLFSGINSIIGFFLNIIFLLRGIDIMSVFEIIDKDSQMSNLMNTLFLYNDDGIMSPFLIIMLCLFIFTMVKSAIDVLKGEKASRILFREFGFFLLALLVTGISLNSGSANMLGKFGSELATELSNEIILSTSEEMSIFSYNTGNTSKDAIETQKSMLSKPMIDIIIEAQFGYPVSELAISRGGNYTSNFGSNIDQSLADTFGSSNKDYFKVYNGENEIHNLGYYWWAAVSGVDHQDPIVSNGIKSATQDRYLFIIDFLENVKNNETDSRILQKIDRIYMKMTQPSYSTAVFGSLLLALHKIALFYSLFLIVIFMSIGKMIVAIGIFFMPILAGLFLFHKTRDFAKEMISTYLSGFLRLVVGALLFNLIISLASILSNQGVFGIIVAIVITYGLGKAMPRILIEINRLVSRNESNYMRPITHGFNKYANRVSRNRRESIENRVKYDKEGNLVRSDESLSGKLGRVVSRKRKRKVREEDSIEILEDKITEKDINTEIEDDPKITKKSENEGIDQVNKEIDEIPVEKESPESKEKVSDEEDDIEDKIPKEEDSININEEEEEEDPIPSSKDKTDIDSGNKIGEKIKDDIVESLENNDEKEGDIEDKISKEEDSININEEGGENPIPSSKDKTDIDDDKIDEKIKKEEDDIVEGLGSTPSKEYESSTIEEENEGDLSTEEKDKYNNTKSIVENEKIDDLPDDRVKEELNEEENKQSDNNKVDDIDDSQNFKEKKHKESKIVKGTKYVARGAKRLTINQGLKIAQQTIVGKKVVDKKLKINKKN